MKGNRGHESTPLHCRPSTSTATTASTNYFSPAQGQSQGQGKYVIRLANLEEENLQLRYKVASLEKWKERMDEWMLDQFGVTVNAEFDRSGGSDRTASVPPASQNSTLENGNGHRPNSPITPNIVKVESLSPVKNPAHSENLNSTATITGTDQQDESDAEDEDGSDNSVQHSESDSETAIPPTQNQNAAVSPLFRPRNLFTQTPQTDSNPSTSAGHSSRHNPEPEGVGTRVSTEENSQDSTPCDICGSPEPEWNNNMVFCDGCNVCVHQACYGITKVPKADEEWKCRTCTEGIEPGTQACLFCPIVGGAMTRVISPSQKQWAHVSCAWWIPEITFGKPDLMDQVINIPKIPKSRWSLRCKLCQIKKGACIQCCYKRCQVAFHVTCAHKQGLKMSINDEGSDGENNPNSLLMHAFCESHTNCDPPSSKRRRTDGTSPRFREKKRV